MKAAQISPSRDHGARIQSRGRVTGGAPPMTLVTVLMMSSAAISAGHHNIFACNKLRVDETGHDRLACRIDDLGAVWNRCRRLGTHGLDTSVSDQDDRLGDRVAPGAVDELGTHNCHDAGARWRPGRLAGAARGDGSEQQRDERYQRTSHRVSIAQPTDQRDGAERLIRTGQFLSAEGWLFFYWDSVMLKSAAARPVALCIPGKSSYGAPLGPIVGVMITGTGRTRATGAI